MISVKDGTMKGQWPNPNTIVCKDCIYRDKTTIELNGKIIPVGVTKSFCEEYSDGKGKPLEILFRDGDCPYFEEK